MLYSTCYIICVLSHQNYCSVIFLLYKGGVSQQLWYHLPLLFGNCITGHTTRAPPAWKHITDTLLKNNNIMIYQAFQRIIEIPWQLNQNCTDKQRKLWPPFNILSVPVKSFCCDDWQWAGTLHSETGPSTWCTPLVWTSPQPACSRLDLGGQPGDQYKGAAVVFPNACHRRSLTRAH